MDPLDREILERALEAVREAHGVNALDSDEGLEAALRAELAELARSHGIDEPEAVTKRILAGLSWTASDHD
jgi:hypothetical protein